MPVVSRGPAPWRSQIWMMRWVRAAESHSSRPVSGGVVGPAVTDPVAFGEGAVGQDEAGFVLAQRL